LFIIWCLLLWNFSHRLRLAWCWWSTTILHRGRPTVDYDSFHQLWVFTDAMLELFLAFGFLAVGISFYMPIPAFIMGALVSWYWYFRNQLRSELFQIFLSCQVINVAGWHDEFRMGTWRLKKFWNVAWLDPGYETNIVRQAQASEWRALGKGAHARI
jgi:hypothetical protein